MLDLGHDVLGLDSLNTYYDPDLKARRLKMLAGYERHHFVQGRVEDASVVAGCVETHKPEVVIHLAAQAGVRYSLENPSAYLDSNVTGTQVLLDALKDHAPSHLMIASTSSVFGGNSEVPFSELHRTQYPMSLYAASKIATEAMAHSYAHLYGMPTSVFRFFTVYGPWGRPDMALFKFISAMEEGASIDVYGHGQMSRDFTYIDDLIDAIERLSSCPPALGEPVAEYDSLSPVAPYRTVNIGNGSPTPLLEFVDAVEAAWGGGPVLRNMLPMQPGDVVRTFADNRLMTRLIGAVDQTHVRDGVARFVQWYRDYNGPSVL